jgi:hypothetical protein|eukprot:COSAG01_NODE_424_length_17253_cov_31.601900_18_plen_78_part_00
MARPRETAKTKLIRLLLLLVNILTLVRPLRPRPRPSRAVPCRGMSACWGPWTRPAALGHRAATSSSVLSLHPWIWLL